MTYTQRSGTPGTQGSTYTLSSSTYEAVSSFTTCSGNLLPTSFQIGIDDNHSGDSFESLVYFDTIQCTSNPGYSDTATTGPLSPTLPTTNGCALLASDSY